MDSLDHVYAVILAGGSGTRFWPKSRKKSPKQLCRIGTSEGGPTMIEQTLGRMDNFIPPERRLIVTHKDQAQKTREIVADKSKTILAEPSARNTTAAICLAALEIAQRPTSQSQKPNIMISLHADHLIEDVEKFLSTLKTAVEVAETGKLTLLGITPKGPETGFGYIERGSKLESAEGYTVKSFREKPNLETAKEFVDSGLFFWNTGIFIWQVDTILREIKELCPTIFNKLKSLQPEKGGFESISDPAFSELYDSLENIAIDHSVLEVSKNVAVVEANFQWQDVGSWDALPESFGTDEAGNYVSGNSLLLDTSDCVIDSDGPLVAALGVKDLVIVHHEGAILVCPKSRSQDVKKVVEQLKQSGRTDLI